MTVPAALVALAVMLAIVAPMALAGASWTRRSPRLGIVAWQATVFAVLASGGLLALTAVVPVDRISFDLAHVVHACPEVIQQRYGVLEDSLLHAISLLIALATLLCLAYASVRCALAVHRGRSQQRDLLDLLVRRRDRLPGVDVLDHPEALAYCVPGARRGRVVITTAALGKLDDGQLRAVLAHERAHLHGRHDLVLFGADVAAAAFPWMPLFRTAQRELSLLVEMLADDRAVRHTDRRTLATALVGLSQSAAPHGAVGASGDTTSRVERLLDDRRRSGITTRALVAGVAVTVSASPWLIAVAPVWAARNGLCPL